MEIFLHFVKVFVRLDNSHVIPSTVYPKNGHAMAKMTVGISVMRGIVRVSVIYKNA